MAQAFKQVFLLLRYEEDTSLSNAPSFQTDFTTVDGQSINDVFLSNEVSDCAILKAAGAVALSNQIEIDFSLKLEGVFEGYCFLPHNPSLHTSEVLMLWTS